MNVVIANMWHRRTKRWGGDPLFNMKNLWRRNVTFYGMVQKESREKESLAMLKVFLSQNIDIERLRICVREFYHNITLIQKRMRDACVARE